MVLSYFFFRDVEMKLFMSSSSSLILLPPPSQSTNSVHQHFSLLLRNQRIFKRIAAKLNKQLFHALQESLFVAAISIDERMTTLSTSIVNTQPQVRTMYACNPENKFYFHVMGTNSREICQLADKI